jgi:hypothetical protein
MRAAIAITLCLTALAAARASASEPSPAEPPSLHAGAVELGLSGALTSVEGSTSGTALVRAGRFYRLGSGLAAPELELSYSHVAAVDELGVEAALSWQRRAGATALYPYFALAAGVREEWVGSFQTMRVPVGATLGLRVLASGRAALRVEYRLRRVMRDPVADYTEQQLLVGVSLLLRNAGRK